MTTELKLNLPEVFEFVRGGPSREDLFDSLRLFGNRGTRVQFELEHRRSRGSGAPVMIEARVTMIQADDGSANQWYITIGQIKLARTPAAAVTESLTMYYNTHDRIGAIIQ